SSGVLVFENGRRLPYSKTTKSMTLTDSGIARPRPPAWLLFQAAIYLFAISLGFSVSPSVFYEIAVLAKTGANSLAGLKPEVSINDFGRVAFIGQDTPDGFSHNQVWTSDGPGNARKVGSTNWGTTSRDFLFPQINNSNLITARDRVPGSPPSFLIR